jgi:hypothetical protein
MKRRPERHAPRRYAELSSCDGKNVQRICAAAPKQLASVFIRRIAVGTGFATTVCGALPSQVSPGDSRVCECERSSAPQEIDP